MRTMLQTVCSYSYSFNNLLTVTKKKPLETNDVIISFGSRCQFFGCIVFHSTIMIVYNHDGSIFYERF